MLIKRLYLRNFRVYEDELDLDLPPGLVGIYGPNGAGKSTLLEAILWTLWGKARTTKEHIRSAGVGGDCVTEVEFEHEGHLYQVRRGIKGVNSTVTVQALCDEMLMSTGTRDAERYVESILGMDDVAFRASVFTEQKQLAAFSNQPPGERRKLVLQLLGISPVDDARDTARKDARELAATHDRLRTMLPDLEQLGVEASDAEAKADATDAAAAQEIRAVEIAEARADTASARFKELDEGRQEYDALCLAGTAARRELDDSIQVTAQQRGDLAEMESLARRLADLEPAARELERAEGKLGLLTEAAAAAGVAEAITVPPEPRAASEADLQRIRDVATTARERLAAHDALIGAAKVDVKRAREAARRSAELSGEQDCPICGQALGEAFEKVQAHRAHEVEAAESRLSELGAARPEVASRAAVANRDLSVRSEEFERARLLRTDWELADRRLRDALTTAAIAWSRAVEICPDLAGTDLPTAATLTQLVAEARRTVTTARAAEGEIQRIRGRLDARPSLERSLATNLEKVDAARARVDALRQKVRTLAFDRAALEAATQERDRTVAAARQARDHANSATVVAARTRERCAAAVERLEEAKARHAQLAELESETLHVAKVADLLSDFRNTVVASVGPRLAEQAAQLFAELTDHEYETLDVDPDTYQLQITDGGQRYGLDRFSGSEIDLANLALRVAISEHIHFQSGGSVGLLVLDEIFGPLDEDRKARMLLALERLKGRFRQVLVVTHDSEIKDQLPGAIEVIKLPGRRATARLLGD
jgi:exonuclease SbcC